MIHLRNKLVRLVVAPEFGCRWMGLTVDRARILAPVRSRAALAKDPFFDGAYLMAPWCNRIPKGRLRFRGRLYRLAPNFPDGSAIHGDVVRRGWRVMKRTRSSLIAQLDSRFHCAFNFPWDVVIRHGVRLTRSGVSSWLSIKNAGDRSCPAGLGFHPFFPRAIRGQTASLRIPPKESVSLDQRTFDEGHDFCGKDIVLDYGSAGRIRLAPGANATDLFVWTPRRFRGKPARFACVEPMTMKVGTFGKAGTRVLKPGESLRLGWAVSFTPASRVSGQR